MQVLVVAKKTNLEVHGEGMRNKIKLGQMDEEYFKLAERAHEEHYENLNRLFEALKLLNISYRTIARGLFWPRLADFAAVITVGGDGTVLEASHHISDSNVILLGIRSSQTSVGRLCHAGGDDSMVVLENLKREQIEVLSVSRLRAKISHSSARGGVTYSDPVLNDFLFANSSPASTSRYRLSHGQISEEHKSSGIWVSTACGSTGVCAAAGGTIIDPWETSFQFVVRELYTYGEYEHRLSKNFFDPDKAPLQVENHSDKAILAMDGHHGQIDLAFGDRIEFVRGPRLKLAKPQMSTTVAS